MKSLHYAPEAWKYLNGVFCVYKPVDVFSRHVRQTLAFNICRDLNEMEKRRPKDLVLLKGSVCSGKPLSVEVVPNYADHELVSGLRYQKQDLRMFPIAVLGKCVAGVQLYVVNDACRHSYTLESSNMLRKYEAKGKFGCATSNYMADGMVRGRTTFSHIRRGALDRLLTSIQTSHQALAFRYSGVDLHSQEAYELASKGIVRPAASSEPIIYAIKCTEFHLPYFTLEIHCINEDEIFLGELIHQIGVYLKSSAICMQLRRTQFGHFTLEHALLRKHWTLEHILNSMTLCKRVLGDNYTSTTAHFDAVKGAEVKRVIEDMQEEVRKDSL